MICLIFHIQAQDLHTNTGADVLLVVNPRDLVSFDRVGQIRTNGA